MLSGKMNIHWPIAEEGKLQAGRTEKKKKKNFKVRKMKERNSRRYARTHTHK
jgi:hypothetical protein